MTIGKIEERALHQHIRSRTVRLLDFTDKSCGGSAVTIKLGSHYFLATAAHVIPRSHDIRILIGEGTDENVRAFSGWHVNDDDDVGLLELSPAIAQSIKREFTDASQLAASLDQSKAWCATLIGYPGQHIDTESRQTDDTLVQTYSFKTLTLVTPVVPTSEWSAYKGFQRQASQRDSDVLVTFDPATQLYEQNLGKVDGAEAASNIVKVELAGMSGCGIWLDQFAQSGTWRAEPFLVGIQTGVHSKQGWARGTLIKKYLELVVKHYDDLAEMTAQLRH